MRTNIKRKGWTLLDAGNDSCVYRIDDHVVKVYEDDVSLELLKTYYTDTAIAARMVKKRRGYIEECAKALYEDYAVHVTVLEQGRIRQVESSLIGEDGYDKVLIGIGQRYINGRDMVDIDAILRDTVQYMPDKNCGPSIKNAIQLAVNTTSRLIRRETGISFDIAPLNVKILPDMKKKRLELIITDLASFIDGAYL